MFQRFVQHYLKQTSVEVKKNRKAILERSTNVRLEEAPPFLTIFKQVWHHRISLLVVTK